MVFHDENLKRMCSVSLPIDQVNKQNRGKYPITGGANINNYQRLLIPSVEEFIEAIGDCVPIIELKHHEGEDYTLSTEGIQTLDSLLKGREVHFISFSETLLLKVKAYFSTNGQYQLLLKNKTKGQIRKAIDWCYENGIHGISMKHTMYDQEVVDYAREKGRKTGAWTVKRSWEALRLTRLGVDYITSNRKL